MNESGTKSLILDLRDNGGGEDELGKLLLSYLLDEPFKYYDDLVINARQFTFQKYTDHTEPLPADLLEVQPNGKYRMVKHPNWGMQQPSKPAFHGKVLILINGGSFSTTSEFLSHAHFHKRATFIGEESGGGYYGNTSGPSLRLTLPHSKVQVGVPLMTYYMAVSGYQAKAHGVLRVFSTNAGVLRMAELVRSLKIREKSPWLGRVTPCSVLPFTRRTPPWASPILRCSRLQSASGAVVITRIGPVRNAASLAPGIGSGPAPCMIWVTRWGAGPVRSTSPTPNITAPGATTTSPPTCLTWPRPRPSTPIGLWPWPSGWWWRTAYPIRPPVGTSGATIGSSSPSPPSRTGWRPGGKKAADQIRAAYLDWALDGFSGYIAADELYDGPFCVLSIVDNRAFKRLCYEVLDHDPARGDIEMSHPDCPSSQADRRSRTA